MTVSAIAPVISYAGNGVATVFTVPFKFLANEDLVVTKTDSSGNAVTLTLGSDYAVTGAGSDSGGSLTLLSILSGLPSGYTLTIRRNTARTQPTSYGVGLNFSEKTHGTSFDRATMIAQEVEQSAVDTKADLESQISSASGGIVADTYLDLANNPAASLSSSGRLRLRLSGGSAQLSANAGIYKNIVPTHFDVRDYGALGDGSTDDTAAINAALAAAQVAGGVVFLPRPAVCYRVTGRLLYGIRWIGEQDVKYVAGGAWNPRAQASYSSAGESSAQNVPMASIIAEPGTDIWADFAPATETAVLYYGASGGAAPGCGTAKIEGLTIVGQAGYVAGARVEPADSHTVTSKLVGICVVESRVDVTRCRVRDVRRGIVGTDNYWSEISRNVVTRTLNAFELLSHNAGDVVRNEVECATYGLIMTGQGVRVRGFDTEGVINEIWMPAVDQCLIDGTYLESVNSDETGYTIALGDPANSSTDQCHFVTIRSSHGDKHYGQHLKLTASHLVLVQSSRHLVYNSSASLIDANSDVTFIECSMPINPASTGIATIIKANGGSSTFNQANAVISGVAGHVGSAGHVFDTVNSLSGGFGDDLIRVRNQGSTVARVLPDGSAVFSGNVQAPSLSATGSVGAASVNASGTVSGGTIVSSGDINAGASGTVNAGANLIVASAYVVSKPGTDIVHRSDVADGHNAQVFNTSNTFTGGSLHKVQNNGSDRYTLDYNGKPIFGLYADTSGTPGDATSNTVTGRSAMAAGASTARITSTCVDGTSIVDVILEDLDATATRVKVEPTGGSFLVTANAAATAAMKFRWKVTN